MKESEVAIDLKNVSKSFYVRDDAHSTLKGILFNVFQPNKLRKIESLKNINLTIKKGEAFGLIGRNGSGKSTMTKLMSGSYTPDKGGVVTRNGTMMLMNLGVGFSHELSARENIYVNGSALGLSIKEIDKLFWDIIEFAELEEFVNTKIKYFSSGMIQRLSFSIAVNAGADIIFLDEVFAVGDAKFKAKAIKMFEDRWITGKTVIMVTHSLGNIEKYCDRAGVMHKGELVFLGKPKEAIEYYNKEIIKN